MKGTQASAVGGAIEARRALDLLSIPIDHDESTGLSEGHAEVQSGLDLMASALCQLKGIDLGAAPLDEVLAELGQDQDSVEAAAGLIDALALVRYGQFVSSEDAERAEEHRQNLYDSLFELLKDLIDDKPHE